MTDTQEYRGMLPLHFHGHRVRMVINDHGIPLWAAQDIGDILGIVQVRSTMRDFPDDEKGVHTVQTPGGPQHVLCVNEPGMYRLIFLSRKPEAETLKRWVFHEVLPTMRRTGQYTLPAPAPQETPAQVPALPVGAVAAMRRTEHLPAPKAPVRESATVSWNLARVWTLLRDAQDPLTNKEIAQQCGMADRTARAHTQYLVQLGLVAMFPISPRALYRVRSDVATTHAAVYERLQALTAMIQERARY